ncbi:MAG: SipW-dependent-type signal peptide-containing protein, partial [Dehalococcoidia bacterium]|nr:SipW-dependent-type signal peptide-containing protein [Dehalococcoidia bacterium]
GGTWAYFSDVETSTGNILTAGTLDLDIGGGDDNVVILQASITDVAPGVGDSDSTLLAVSGTLAGELDITITSIDSEENSIIVDAESVGGPDITEGLGEGELDANTWIAFWLDYQNVGGWSTNDVGLKSDASTYTFAAATTGTATGGSIVTIQDSGGGFGSSSEQVGYPVTVTGTVNGTAVIISHTDTELTVATPFSAAITNESYSIATGPHYDLASTYNGDVFNAAIASMADTYDFNVEWVVPITVGNVIMSDTLDIDLSFTLEQTDAD